MEHDETMAQTPVETTTGSNPDNTTRRERTPRAALPATKRTPAVKPRTLEELDMLDAKKMTPAESVLYINALRDVITRQKNQSEEMQKVTKSSFEQFRNADDSYAKLRGQYNADIALAKQIINTAAKTIALIGGSDK